MAAIQKAKKASAGCVSIIGIAADELIRIERHKDKPNILMPLMVLGWKERFCLEWCNHNELRPPTYDTGTRDGCWFCHNQGVEQLRLLRKNYPEHWALLLKWDKDSPVPFKADGYTVHDYDRRFRMEEQGLIPTDRTFRWEMLDNPPKFIAMSGEQLTLWEGCE